MISFQARASTPLVLWVLIHFHHFRSKIQLNRAENHYETIVFPPFSFLETTTALVLNLLWTVNMLMAFISPSIAGSYLKREKYRDYPRLLGSAFVREHHNFFTTALSNGTNTRGNGGGERHLHYDNSFYFPLRKVEMQTNLEAPQSP